MTETKFPLEVENLVTQWKDKKGNLIMILHAIQDHYGYVPKEEAFKLSTILDVPVARIYEVITFYNFFKLKPPGKHRIAVCMGTACYLKGAPEIIKEIERLLNIKEGETTDDGLFQLEHVRCIGCCGLAPVIAINDEVYGKVSKNEIAKILDKYKQEG